MADTPRLDDARLMADFSAAAPLYDAHAELQSLIREDALEIAASQWPQGSFVLDVGCGTGSFAGEARQRGMHWHVIGTDLAPGMARAASRQLHAAVANAAALPFADASFHGVFSNLMLQWAPQPLQVLREMARVLRPGGRAVITTFTHGTLEELRQSFSSLDDSPRVMPFLSSMELSAYAAHAGFALRDAEEEEFIERYTTLESLMRTLKAIGAGNKDAARRRGMTTPRQMAQVEYFYRNNFGDAESIPATWHALTLVLEKP